MWPVAHSSLILGDAVDLDYGRGDGRGTQVTRDNWPAIGLGSQTFALSEKRCHHRSQVRRCA